MCYTALVELCTKSTMQVEPCHQKTSFLLPPPEEDDRNKHYITSRGVQYVHRVMHKCIMVKIGGKGNTHKVCKKQVNFCKTEGKFLKAEGNNNFRETEGKCTETEKIGGKFGIYGR